MGLPFCDTTQYYYYLHPFPDPAGHSSDRAAHSEVPTSDRQVLGEAARGAVSWRHEADSFWTVSYRYPDDGWFGSRRRRKGVAVALQCSQPWPAVSPLEARGIGLGLGSLLEWMRILLCVGVGRLPTPGFAGAMC